MKDSDCIAFLQWALPRLQLRWPGYRKVRRQVCKRVSRRMRSLDIDSVEAYRAHLDANPAEWAVLDEMTRITISRFFRERDVFQYLCETALPELHRLADPEVVRVWSAGCAGGEEAYSLAIAARLQDIPIRIVATDWDEHQLSRAREGSYAVGCLKDLPPEWRRSAFERDDNQLSLRKEYRAGVELLRQDIRRDMPDGPFHLVLCRYLAFTYFEETVQRDVARGLLARTVPKGLLVLGKHESWPLDVAGVAEVKPGLRVYQKL